MNTYLCVIEQLFSASMMGSVLPSSQKEMVEWREGGMEGGRKGGMERERQQERRGVWGKGEIKTWRGGWLAQL